MDGNLDQIRELSHQLVCGARGVSCHYIVDICEKEGQDVQRTTGGQGYQGAKRPFKGRIPVCRNRWGKHFKWGIKAARDSHGRGGGGNC